MKNSQLIDDMIRSFEIENNMKYSIHSKFDLKKHKEIYINYFEAIINPDGSVEYAVPSHDEIAYKKYMNKFKITRDELFEKFKYKDLYGVVDELGIILCWFEGYRLPKGKDLTDKQVATLKILIKEEVMKGKEIF